jgi:hypothetical protein
MVGLESPRHDVVLGSVGAVHSRGGACFTKRELMGTAPRTFSLVPVGPMVGLESPRHDVVLGSVGAVHSRGGACFTKRELTGTAARLTRRGRRACV